MPDIEKLHLEDAFEDSPQTRSLLSVFERDALSLKKYTAGLHGCCQRVMKAQNELCAATQSLAQHLRTYETMKFPLESEDSILISTLKQFASYLDDVSSVHQVLATQYSETMMYPVNKFQQADIEEISTMFEMFQIASHEHEQAMNKYMKLPRKKDNEKQRIEANEELYGMRKKFHQTSLHYYSCLNALQYKRKCFLLEPIMGYLHAQRAFFQMGQDTLCKPQVEEFLSNIASSVQGVHRDLGAETQRTVELIDTIEQQSAHRYHGEPPVDMPYIPPNTSLAQKGGYLFLRSKPALITTKWERVYFFTQGGNLMSQAREEVCNLKSPKVAGSLVLDLNEEGIMAEPCEVDDRRFVFQVTAPHAKKTVILQAENERERDEWIATINNIAKDSGYVRGKQAMKKKESTGSIGGASSTDSALPKSPQSESHSIISPSGGSTPEAFVLDTPIQFDLVAPSNKDRAVVSPQAGPPKRINPFDQSAAQVLDSPIDNAAFSENFTVRFLGSMEVKNDRGEPLVHNTIRQIMAARAIHNVFKMTEYRLVVTNEGMRLVDPSLNTVRLEFALQDVSFWAVHPENNRLFGFITRNRTGAAAGGGGGGAAAPVPSFACHVFESNNSAEDICQAIAAATQIAYQALVEKKAGEKITQVKNKEKLADAEDAEDAKSTMPLSPDGKFLLLGSGEDEDPFNASAMSAVAGAAAAPPPPEVSEEDDHGESEA